MSLCFRLKKKMVLSTAKTMHFLSKLNASNYANCFKLFSTSGSNRFQQSSLVASAASPKVTLVSDKEAAPLPLPRFDGQPKQYSAKISSLVEQIAQLNLLEVSDLNELLRKTLNIKDVAMAAPVAGGVAAAAPAQKVDEEPEAEAPKAVKSSYRLKLIKYDEAKKVQLIKEVKALGQNMNLVQAKKFIESVPQVFRDNISKDEVEKLKEQLEKCGATCEIE